jgi:hypothetical protein
MMPAPPAPPAPATTDAAPGASRPPSDTAASSAWAAAGRPTRRLHLRLGATEATVVLLVLDVLFAAFVALQVTYLFGGRSTLPDVGLTYAEYARRGFFELVVVAALVGALVLVLDALVARRSRSFVVATLGLLGLTAVVLASAAFRLRLYQDAFGWTELRFYVYVAIAVLAASAALAAALVLADRVRWLVHGFGWLVLTGLLACAVVGPSAFVAGQNLARVVDPSLVPPDGRTGLDAEYLASLPDDAVPAIVEALPRVPPAVRTQLEAVLAERAAALAHPSVAGWPSWNLARDRARAALASAGFDAS